MKTKTPGFLAMVVPEKKEGARFCFLQSENRNLSKYNFVFSALERPWQERPRKKTSSATTLCTVTWGLVQSTWSLVAFGSAVYSLFLLAHRAKRSVGGGVIAELRF